MRKLLLILIIVISTQFLYALDFNSPALLGVGKNLSTFFPDRVVDIYNFPFNFANDNCTNSYFSYMQIWEGAQISSFRVVSKPDYKIGILLNVNHEANDRYFPYKRGRYGWSDAYYESGILDENHDDFSQDIYDNDTPETDDDLMISDRSDGIFYEKYNNSGLAIDLKFLLSKPEEWGNVFYIDLSYLHSYDPPEGLHYAKYEKIIQPVENNTDYRFDYHQTTHTKLADCDQTKFEIRLGNSVYNPAERGHYLFNYSINFLNWMEDSQYFDSFEIYIIDRLQSDIVMYNYEQNHYEDKYEAYGFGSTLQYLNEKQLKYAKSLFSFSFDIGRLRSVKYDDIEFSYISGALNRGYYFKPNSFSSAAIGVKFNMKVTEILRSNLPNNTEDISLDFITPIGMEFTISPKLIMRFGWAFHLYGNNNHGFGGNDYNFGFSYVLNNYNFNFAFNKEMIFSKPLISFSCEKDF